MSDKISIIFPAYNERDTIEIVLREWKAQLEQLNLSYQFIVCEDGSKDGTKEFLQKIQQNYNLVIDSRIERRGYGRAVVDGILAAKTDFVFCVDSDGQYDPADFPKFWERRNDADIFMGWRIKRADVAGRKIGAAMFRCAFLFLFPCKLHDITGFCLFTRNKVIPHIQYLFYLNEPFWYNLIGMAIKKGLSIDEIPINHRKRLQGETKIYQFTKAPMVALRNLWGLIKLKLAK